MIPAEYPETPIPVCAFPVRTMAMVNDVMVRPLLVMRVRTLTHWFPAFSNQFANSNLCHDSLVPAQLRTGIHNAVSDGFYRRRPRVRHCAQDQSHCILRRSRLHVECRLIGFPLHPEVEALLSAPRRCSGPSRATAILRMTSRGDGLGKLRPGRSVSQPCLDDPAKQQDAFAGAGTNTAEWRPHPLILRFSGEQAKSHNDVSKGR